MIDQGSLLPVLPYPEEIRETPLGQLEVEVQVPTQHAVVMGASGKPEQEVYTRTMAMLGIPLYKRKGGGGTVVLGPETVVVTVHAGVVHPFHNLAYFKAINQALIQCFGPWTHLPFQLRGISDIAANDRKVVGTSIFRRRQYMLYQASILVDLNLNLMNQVLRHPPKEPDYRQKRDHAQFLTCLRELGVATSTRTMVKDLQTNLPRVLPTFLAPVNGQP